MNNTEFLILATLDTLFDTRSLTSWYALPFFCTKFITRTHIHANASILLVLDVRPEGLAINSLEAQPQLSLLFMLYDSGHLQSSTSESLRPFPRTGYPTIFCVNSLKMLLHNSRRYWLERRVSRLKIPRNVQVVDNSSLVRLVRCYSDCHWLFVQHDRINLRLEFEIEGREYRQIGISVPATVENPVASQTRFQRGKTFECISSA